MTALTSGPRSLAGVGPDEDTPDDDPGEDDPGEDDPGEDDPGEDDPGEDDPGEDDPGDDDPGEDDPGEDDPGEDDPGDEPTDDPAAGEPASMDEPADAVSSGAEAPVGACSCVCVICVLSPAPGPFGFDPAARRRGAPSMPTAAPWGQWPPPGARGRHLGAVAAVVRDVVGALAVMGGL